jgi:hypothetical protein
MISKLISHENYVAQYCVHNSLQPEIACIEIIDLILSPLCRMLGL